jgi:hypothetical protein
VLEMPDLGGPFAFVLDRGCYQHVRTCPILAFAHRARFTITRFASNSLTPPNHSLSFNYASFGLTAVSEMVSPFVRSYGLRCCGERMRRRVETISRE